LWKLWWICIKVFWQLPVLYLLACFSTSNSHNMFLTSTYFDKLLRLVCLLIIYQWLILALLAWIPAGLEYFCVSQLLWNQEKKHPLQKLLWIILSRLLLFLESLHSLDGKVKLSHGLNWLFYFLLYSLYRSIFCVIVLRLLYAWQRPLNCPNSLPVQTLPSMHSTVLLRLLRILCQGLSLTATHWVHLKFWILRRLSSLYFTRPAVIISEVTYLMAL